MKCYRVWYNNGAAVLIDAYSERDAKEIALEQAEKDGYPGLSIKKVESLSEE